jgi:hypothetical protein
MANRSNRGSGEPEGLTRLERDDLLGPDLRTSSGHAVISTASTGRTHDCTRRYATDVIKVLALWGPSMTCSPKTGPRRAGKFQFTGVWSGGRIFHEESAVQRLADRVHSPAGGARNHRRGGLPQGRHQRGHLLQRRNKYGGLMPSEMKRPKQLEEENGRLKKIWATKCLRRFIARPATPASRSRDEAAFSSVQVVQRRGRVQFNPGLWLRSDERRGACHYSLVRPMTAAQADSAMVLVGGWLVPCRSETFQTLVHVSRI